MKKLLLLILILPVFISSQTNLVKWSNSNFTPTYLENHISASNIMSSQVSIQNDTSYGTANLSFVSDGWPKPNYITPANSVLDAKKYLAFEISPEEGYRINLSAFTFNGRTKGEPSLIEVRYSRNADFSTYAVLQKEKSLSITYKTFDLKFPANTIVNSKTTLYIRIYVYKTNNDFHIEYNSSGTVAPIISGTVSLEKPLKPVATDDRAATMKNKAVTIGILENDNYKSSGDLSAISIVSAPQHGNVVIKGRTEVTYTPAKNYTGYDFFYYTITNAIGVSNTAKVEVQVIDSNIEAQKPLVRWNRKDQTSKNYSPKSLLGNSLSYSVDGLTATSNSFIVSDLPTPLEFNGTLDPKKYLQMSVAAFDGVTALNSFTMRYRSTGEGNMTIKYSKSEDFTGAVYTFNEADKLRYTGKEASIVANFPVGMVLFPGEKLYLRIYIYNTYQPKFTIDFSQDGEVGPALMGVVADLESAPKAIWDGKKWEGGLLPDATKLVFISGNYNTLINGSFEALALTVNNKAILTVEEEHALTVQHEILTMDGSSLLIRNEANLIQVNDAFVNTGNITVERKANLKRLDYIYWASPVKGQDLKQFSPGTVDTRFYTYNEANNLFESINPKNTVFGNNATGFESEAKGYAIRASNYYPAATPTADAPMQVFNAVFKGVPNNGLINFSLKYQTKAGKSVGNGHNLIGNPYPSNIDFNQLVDDNKNLIKGTAYFWTNVNPNPSMQGGSYPKEGSINNYAVLNGAGSIPATQGRVGGLRSKKPTNVIEVGQGFIVQAKKEGVLTFKNAYRTDAAHGVFFNKGTAGNKQPRLDRYWLELKTPLDVVTTALVAYVEQASDEYEDRYDAPLLSVGSDALFTKVDDYRLGIQGRGYPLQKTDVVHLGAGFYEAGEYTLSISSSEGIFEDGQNVYLKDKQTGIITNLTTNPYTFTAAKGLDDDRFELLYQVENTLGTTVSSKDQLVVYRSDNDFVVQSKTDKIALIEVYETSGRLIMSVKPHQKQTRIAASNWTSGMYVLKITTASLGNQNGNVITKKIVK